MKSIFTILALITSLMGLKAQAHGEDQPGPHGGHIQMPGAFHTELVLVGTSKVKIYLLDMNWKNPITGDSSVSLEHKTLKTNATCAKASDHFVCTFPNTVDLKNKGELSLISERQKQKGAIAIYQLPLGFKSNESSHSGHH